MTSLRPSSHIEMLCLRLESRGKGIPGNQNKDRQHLEKEAPRYAGPYLALFSGTLIGYTKLLSTISLASRSKPINKDDDHLGRPTSRITSLGLWTYGLG